VNCGCSAPARGCPASRVNSAAARELQRYHLPPARLESLANEVGGALHLDAKLHDLALILRAYADWLDQHGLQDADRLLDMAATALEANSHASRWAACGSTASRR